MLSNLASKLGLTSKPASQSFLKPRDPSKNMLTKVDYTSNDIPIPDTFLSSPPENPIATHPIDFANSPLPQYDGHTAIVLDNVLSPEECKELLSLAEASVPKSDESAPAWRPALISAGPGWEAPAPGYRESDRIIWNQQTVVDRLWERCMLSEGLRELLAVVPPQPYMKGGKWVFSRFNERMRFLKYSPGQFFKRKRDHLSLVFTANVSQPTATVLSTIPKAQAKSLRLSTLFTYTSMTLLRMIQLRNLKVAQRHSLTEKERRGSM